MPLLIGAISPNSAHAAAIPIPTLLNPQAAVEYGYRDFSFGTNTLATPTGEKPQSKLWWNDGVWWGCLWDSSARAHSIYRFDMSTQTWTKVGPQLDNRSNTLVDVLWDGSVLYVVSHLFDSNGDFRLYSCTYNSNTQSYSLRSGFPVTMNSGTAEALTIAKDTTGQLWITWEQSNDIMINRSVGSETSWAMPFRLPVQGADVHGDDISAITAFGSRIGVLWSNQGDKKMYFSYHDDADGDTTWSSREDALAQAGLALADDHMNFALACSASDPCIFASTKTSLGSTGDPQIYLLRRDPSGSWTHDVVTNHEDSWTRPIVLVDDENRKIYVFGQCDVGDDGIRVKESDLDNISFASGPGTLFIETGSSPNMNNPTSTKQTLNGTTDLLVMASDEDSRYYFHNTIDLAESAPQPEIAATPAFHDYGDVLVGSSASQTFQIQNLGTATLQVTSISLAGTNPNSFTISSGGGAFNLSPGNTHDIVVNFEPGSTGAKAALLRLRSNDADEDPLDLALNGVGVLPDIAVNPGSHDFGATLVDSVVTQSFQVHNEGTSNLNVSATSLTGTDAAEFAIGVGGGAFIVAPGDSHAVVVTFQPASIGPKSAALSITSDDPDESPLDIGLAGTGIDPDIAVSPLTHDFGPTLLDSIATQTFQVRNTGTSNLNVSATSLTGTDATEFFITSGGGAFAVAPGDSHAVIVAFQPASIGPKSAALRITSDDPDESPLDIALAGTGGLPGPEISVDPMSEDFGASLLDSVVARTFQIRNSGTLDLQVSSTSLSGLDAAEFAIASGEAPFVVAPGDSHALRVDFTPTTLGSKVASLQIESDDPDEALVDVSLAGAGVLPEIAVEPTSDDFGDLRVDSTSTHFFQVRNVGTADLTVSDLTLIGTDAAEFVVSAGAAPFTLAPGDSQAVSLSFTPTSTGSKSASLRIESDDRDTSTFDVPLAGNGVLPDIAITPAAYDYGSVFVDSLSSHVFQVRNEGSTDLTVTGTSLVGTNASEFTLGGGTAPFVVAPGDSHAVTVIFAPSSEGPKSAALQVDSDDLDETPFDVALSGTALLLEPDIAAVPPSLDYGAIAVGAVATLTFQIHNEGTADLDVTLKNILGPDAPEFSISSGGGDFIVAPGDSHQVAVDFQPVSTGSKSASVKLMSNDPDENPLNVDLAGSGIPATADIAVTPASHDFGDLDVDSTATQIFQVHNGGATDLDVTATTLSGTHASEFGISGGAAPFTVAPGDSHAVSVEFHPSGVGSKSASLDIGSNDPDSSLLQVALSGTGVQPDIAVDSASHDFGPTLVDSVSSWSFQVRNQGSADLNVSATSLVGADAPEFGVPSGGGAFVVTPGDSHAVTVQFQPASVGAKAATLQISSDDPDEDPFDIAISGSGVIPDIAIAEMAHDFGATLVDSVSSWSFQVHNAGTADLNVSSTSLVGPDAAAFAITGGGAFVVAPGDSQAVTVQFQPLSAGAKAATLQIASDDPDEDPFDIALTGSGVVPDIAVIPAAHDFGPTFVDSIAARTFQVHNLGSADLNVSATSLVGPDVAAFAITGGGGAFVVAPGDSHAVIVQFQPASAGTTAATLQITSDDPDENPLDVALSGVGMLLEPDIAVDPAHDFGPTLVDSVSSWTFQVHNAGTAGLNVGATSLVGPDAIEFAITSGGGAFVVAPGDSHAVAVQFQPTSVGAKTATLQITSDDPDEDPFDIALTGSGVIPDIAIAETSHDFGATLVDSVASWTFQVHNAGTADLNVSATSLVGADAPEFGVPSGGGAFVVTPGDSHAVTVQFQPTSVGAKAATLQIASDDPDENPFEIALTGSGVIPDIVIAETSHDFGATLVDSVASYTFQVHNAGTADLNIGGSALVGPDASEFGILGGGAFVVAPGDSHAVTVQFQPASVGAKAATLQISSDDPDESPFDISLSGTAIAPDIAVNPASYDFGSTLVDSTATWTFQVHNVGSANLNVSAASVAGPDAAEFAITSGGGTFIVAPGDSHAVTVQFQPVSVGAKTATLQIASDDPDESPFDIVLTGAGVVPDVAVTPSSLDFGLIKVDSTSTWTFQVHNAGSADLNVSATSLVGPDAAEFAIISGGGSFVVAPGDSQAVAVQFQPASVGAKAATLQITSDDPDENPFDVALSGTGAVFEPDIAVMETAHGFGATLIDSVSSWKFQVHNVGTADLNVSATSLVGTDATEFAITSGGGAFIVAPGDSQAVTMQFQPTSVGTKSATLQITSDDPDESPFDIALTGSGVIPDIAVAETAHDFGATLVDSVSSWTFQIHNEGSADLNVSTMSLMGTNALEFTIVGGGAFTVAPADSQSVTARFQPTSAGAKAATLQIWSDDPDESPFDISLSGTALAPDITVNPASYDFGSTLVDSAATWTFQVHNVGSANLNVSAASVVGPDATELAITSGGGAFIVASGDSHAVTVQFQPTSAGAKSATLQITSDDPDESLFDVPLSGTGIAPDIAVNPASHDFGATPVDSTATWTFQVHNQGSADLNVNATALVGTDPLEFAITGGGAFVVAPGDSHAVTVQFQPTSVGTKSATLQITSDDLDESPFGIALAGTGVVPDVAVTPSSHDFGAIEVDSASTWTFQVRNVGSADLNVGATSLVGTDAAAFAITSSGGAFVVAPGDSHAVTVQFQPTSVGAKSATLQITSDDPDESPFDVALSGTGVLLEPDIAVNPASHDFGATLVDSLSSWVFQVHNVGSANLNVSATSLFGPDAAAFAITSGGGAFVVAPGDSHAVTVQFQPTSVGTKSATLEMTSDDPDAALFDVPLAGTGVAPEIVIAPAAHDYGNVLVDSTDSQSFVVRNDGSADLHVLSTSLSGADFGDFAVTSGGGGFVVAPGDSHVVIVTFTPATPGSKSATLEVLNDDADESSTGIALTGTGVAPGIAVTPVSYDYGDVLVDSTASKSFQVHNVGSAALSITATMLTGPEAPDFTITGGGGAFVVAPGDSHEVSLSFTPTAVGVRVAGLQIVSDDPDSGSLDIPLTGTGVLPAIAVVPATYDFGDVEIDSIAVQTFQVHNTGTANLDVTSSLLSGLDPTEFGIASGAAPFTVAPGDSHAIQVQFSPTEIGSKSALLQLVSDDPGQSLVEVSLVGNGVLLIPDIAVTPTSYSFSTIVLGDSLSQPFQVRNEGTGPLHVASPSISGADSTQFKVATGVGGFNLAPGDSFDIVVRFVPTSEGAKGAMLQLPSDDPDESPLSLLLAGSAVAAALPDLDVVAFHDFGFVDADSSLAFAFVVGNTGLADLHVTSASLIGADSLQFSVSNGDAPFTVSPEQNHLLTVTFAPTSLGAKSATLRLASDDPDENPWDIELQGTGGVPDLAVDTLAHDFGSIAVGGTVPFTLHLWNQGSYELNVLSTQIGGTNADEFQLASGAAPFTLAPGDTHQVQLDFVPSTTGPKSALLTIASDDPQGGAVSVVLAGSGMNGSSGGGLVGFEESVSGGSTDASLVSTATPMSAVSGDLYLASITSKSYTPVASVTGMGMSWSLLVSQCSGRDQTGVEIWLGQGVPQSGVITAQLTDVAKSAAIIVSRYSGVDPDVPLGSMISGNTQGLSGTCSGGTDSDSLSFAFTTTTDNALVFSAVAVRQKDFMPGVGWTQRDLERAGVGGDASGTFIMDRSVPAAGTISLDGTFDSSVDWAVIGIEIRPAPFQTTDAPDSMTPDAAVREASLQILGGQVDSGTRVIEIALPEASPVRLTLHDVRGRLVLQIWSGTLPAGRHRLQWPRMESAAETPAGIYFLRARAGDRVLSRKLLILH